MMMSPETRREVMRTFMLSLWGLLTMILFFMVVLLVNELRKTGQDPMALLRPSDPQASEGETRTRSASAPTLGAREVSVYFIDETGQALMPETHTIEFTASTLENCRNALRALINGPHGLLAPVLPASVKLRGLYLIDGGELVVDFSRELTVEHARFKSASLEALMIYAVVNTVTQPELKGEDGQKIWRVRFLFDGLPQDTFPAHIDVGQPLGPDPSWISAMPMRESHG